MRKVFTASIVASLAALLFVATAYADITGTIYNVTGVLGNQTGCTGGDGTAASCATPANAGIGTAEATFDLASGNIDFNPTDSSSIYTIGGFITSDPATATCTDIIAGSCAKANGMMDTLWVITGTATVTTGEAFSAGHDDGLTLTIGGTTVISAPGPTAFNVTGGTYSGPTGNEAFQLVYGECCGAPASLTVNGLGLVSTTPEPTSVILIPVMLLGVALGSRKWISRAMNS